MATEIRLYVGGAPAVCRGCGAAIEWFKTVNGRSMPMNAGALPRRLGEAPDGHAIGFYASADAHWATCPRADQFGSRRT